MMREAFEYYCEWAIERFIFGMNYKLVPSINSVRLAILTLTQ